MKLRPAKQSVLLTLWLTGLSISIAHAADPVEELKACAKMTDRDARFVCYDDLGQRVLGEESADIQSPPEVAVQAEATETAVATEAAQAAATASNTPSLPDDLGHTVFENNSQSEKAPDRGLVTSCKQGPDKRWYFFFDNGQVWRQSNVGRHRFNECNFVATVTRDAFGYKMQIEGETRKIRVARKK